MGEPGAYFSGDLGIGNVMRLYSALLGWKWIVANSRQRQRILRDMYSLAVYHKLKHVENRKEAIGRLLGIDLARGGTYLPPIHEPNPPDRGSDHIRAMSFVLVCRRTRRLQSRLRETLAPKDRGGGQDPNDEACEGRDRCRIYEDFHRAYAADP